MEYSVGLAYPDDINIDHLTFTLIHCGGHGCFIVYLVSVATELKKDQINNHLAS